jgi:hypothetical protein
MQNVESILWQLFTPPLAPLLLLISYISLLEDRSEKILKALILDEVNYSGWVPKLQSGRRIKPLY